MGRGVKTPRPNTDYNGDMTAIKQCGHVGERHGR